MALLPTLDLIIAEQDKSGDRPSKRKIAALIASKNEEEQVGGFIYRACDLFRSGNPQTALEILFNSRKKTGFVPFPVIANIIWLAEQLGMEQRAAHECMRFAVDTCKAGYDNIALEAASTAIILDTLGNFEIIRTPELALETVLLYEKIAARHSPAAANCQQPTITPPPSVTPAKPEKKLINVGMIVPNLVDYIVAYTQRTLHFARYLDSSRFRFFVYSTENFSAREKPLFPFGAEGAITKKTGAASIQELKEHGVPVYLTPRNVDFIEASHLLSAKMSHDSIDVALFQGGLATPIDWLTARFSTAPVKAAIHIGSSLMTPGLDVTFFDNPSNIERENKYWLENAGERFVLPKAVDIENLAAQQPTARARFGIPPDPETVVIGTMSNALYKRMTEEYMRVIADVMKRHKKTWFLAFGCEPIPDKMKFFEAAGVADRVKFGGKQSRTGSALKALDIYANEFPVGGAQSVMEAMACGIPVVAIKWSDAHAESAGANVVGRKFAIPKPDPNAYAALLEKWVTDKNARNEAALLQQNRAEKRFSTATYVNTVLEHALKILEKKQTSA